MWVDAIGRAEIQKYNVIFLVVEDSIDQRDQFRMLFSTQPTLKHRKLQPLTVAVHQFEQPPPAPLVRDIICNDVESMVHYSSRNEIWIVRQIAQ